MALIGQLEVFGLASCGGRKGLRHALSVSTAELVTNRPQLGIDGGAFLGGGGGSFWQLSRLGDQDWENIRSTIKSANEKDKAQRTA